jgi:hypothetical protein
MAPRGSPTLLVSRILRSNSRSTIARFLILSSFWPPVCCRPDLAAAHPAFFAKRRALQRQLFRFLAGPFCAGTLTLFLRRWRPALVSTERCNRLSPARDDGSDLAVGRGSARRRMRRSISFADRSRAAFHRRLVQVCLLSQTSRMAPAWNEISRQTLTLRAMRPGRRFANAKFLGGSPWSALYRCLLL